MPTRRLFDGAQDEIGLLPLEGLAPITGTVAVTQADASSSSWGYIDPYRANLWDESKIETLDDAYWDKAAGSVTANTRVPPIGLPATSDADRWVENSGTSDHFIYRQPSLAATTRYVLSAFVRQVGGGRDACSLFSTGTGCKFDLANLTYANIGSRFNSAGILDAGDGWRLLWYNFDSDTATTYVTGIASMDSYGGSGFYLGDGRACFDVWGLKLEQVDDDADVPSPLFSSGVEGTVAVTQESQTSAASGTSTVLGTSAQTQADQTPTTSGTVVLQGSAGASQSDDTSAASGSPVVAGSVAQAQSGDVPGASGSPVVSGTSAQTQVSQTPAVSGTSIVQGTSAQTQADQTPAASGTSIVQGTVAVSAADAVATGSGSTIVLATAAMAQAEQTSAAQGTSVIQGTSAQTQDPDVGDAQGSVGSGATGSVSVTQAPDIGAASGTAVLQGSAGPSQDPQTSGASGSPAVVGTSAQTQDSQAPAASGTPVISGTSAQTQIDHVAAHRVPLFGWDTWSSGLSQLSEEITINAQTLTPTFSYRGADADAATWGGTYGPTLDIDATKGSVDPTLDNLGPFIDDTLDVRINPSGKVYSTASGPDFGTDDIVGECVFMVDDLTTSAEHTIVAKYSGSNPRWALIVATNGSITFYANTAVSSMNLALHTAGAVVSGAWYHLIFFVDRSGSGISYLNGSTVGSATSVVARAGETLDNSAKFQIGTYDNAAAGRVFNGHIALVRAWKGAAWLNTHLQPTLAMERFSRLNGTHAQYHAGSGAPLVQSRSSTNYALIQRNGEISGYKVGANWVNVDKRTDENVGVQVHALTINPYTYSVELENAAWTKLACTVSVSAELGPAPDYIGGGNLRTIDGDGTTAEHGVTQTPATTVTGGNPNFVTLSVIAKPGNQDWLYIECPTIANAWAYFNVATGALGTVGSTAFASRTERYRGGSYRCEICFLGITGATAYTARVQAASGDGGKVYAGAAGDLHVGWVQLESNHFLSSSLNPTTSASVSRIAGVFYHDATNNVPQGAPTTFVTQFFMPLVNPAGGNSVGGMNHGGANNGLSSAGWNASLQANRLWITSGAVGGVSQWVFGSIVPNYAVPPAGKKTHRVTMAFDDVRGYAQGAVYNTDTLASLPSGLTRINVGTVWNHTGHAQVPLVGWRIYDGAYAPGEGGTPLDVVLGTSAQTQDAQTSTASGAPVVTGTSAPTQAAQAPAVSGSPVVSGSSAQTQVSQTSAASGTSTVAGSSAQAQAAQTSTAQGLLATPGQAPAAQQDQTSTVSGTLVLQGQALADATDDTSTIVGGVGQVNYLAVTAADQRASVSAQTFVRGVTIGDARAVSALLWRGTILTRLWTGDAAPALHQGTVDVPVFGGEVHVDNISGRVSPIARPFTIVFGALARSQAQHTSQAQGLLLLLGSTAAVQDQDTIAAFGVAYVDGALSATQDTQAPVAEGTTVVDGTSSATQDGNVGYAFAAAPLDPIFGWDSFSSGLSFLDEVQTINGVPISPSLFYVGDDAISGAGTWSGRNGAGPTLSTVGSGNAITYDELTPFLDDTRCVSYSQGQCHQASDGGAGGDLGTDDVCMVFVLRQDVASSTNGRYISKKQVMADVTPGWALYNSGASQIAMRLGNGATTAVETWSTGGALGTFLIVGLCWNRDEVTSANSLRKYVGGSFVSSSARSTFSTGVTSTDLLTFGALSPLTETSDAGVVFCGMWKGADMFPAGAAGATEMDRVMRRIVDQITGLEPDYATGQRESRISQSARGTAAHLYRKIGTDYHAFLVGVGWPRVMHWPGAGTDGHTGLFSERAAVNTLLRSATFSTLWTETNITTSTSPVYATSPNFNQLTGNRAVKSTASGASSMTQTVTMATSTKTLSFAFVPGIKPWAKIAVPTLTDVYGYFMADGTTPVTGTLGANVVDAGIHVLRGSDGLCECWIVFVPTAADHDVVISIAEGDGDDAVVSTVDFQQQWAYSMLVDGHKPTSLTTTVSAAVTRNADTIVFEAADNFPSSGVATVRAEIAVPQMADSITGVSDVHHAVSLHLGTGNPLVYPGFFNGTTGLIDTEGHDGVGTMWGPVPFGVDVRERKSINRLFVDVDDVEYWQDGVSVFTDVTVASIPMGMDRFNIGMAGSGSSNIDGLVVSLKVYDERVAPGEQGTGDDVTAGGVTGTAAATQATQTSTASGTVVLWGSSGAPQGDDTVTAQGQAPVTGASAQAQAGDVPGASGSPVVSGTSAPAQTPDIGEAAGSLGGGGSASPTQDSQTPAVSGTPVVTGTSAQTQGTDVGEAQGSVGSGASGTVAVTQAAQDPAASGSPVVTGTSAQTQAPDVGEAQGSVGSGASGTVAVVEDDHTPAASGTPLVQGTSAQAQDAGIGAAQGTVVLQGTSAQAQDAGIGAAQGTSIVQGTSSQAQDEQTPAASGTSIVQGTSAETQEAQAPAVSGSPAVEGSSAQTQEQDVGAAEGDVGGGAVEGTIAVTEDGHTPTAQGSPTVAGTSAQTQDTQTPAASGSPVVNGTSAQTQDGQSSTAAGFSGTSTITLGVATASTSNANNYTTGSFTPAANDLLVAFVAATDTTAAGTLENSGTNLGWTRVTTHTWDTGVDTAYLFVANALAPATAITCTFRCTGDNATGSVVTVLRVSNMTRAGLSAIFQSAGQSDQAAAGTPAPAFATAAKTWSPIVGLVANSSNPAALTPPSTWSEESDTGYNSPTTGSEVVSKANGFTGTTVTWGSTSATAFASIIAELDASPP